mgnify:CR=1 FL=1
MRNVNDSVEVIIHAKNGNEDDVKFVEVDGVKYQADDKDPAKPKLDDKGDKIPLKSGGGDKGGDKGGSPSLEELAKTNPEIAKLLDDQKKRKDEDEKRDKEQKEREEKEAAEKGQWKELAEKRAQEHEETKKQLNQKEEMLGKYVGSVKQMLKEVMETIPEDKKGLVPDSFSPREKLEYITKNAKLLGANVMGSKGGGVPPNEVDPPSTEEGKLIAELEELRKKATKTSADHTKIFELSKKIKEVRAAAQRGN